MSKANERIELVNGLSLGPDPEMGFDPLNEDDTGLPCIVFVSEKHKGCIPQIRVGMTARAVIERQDIIFSISDDPIVLCSNAKFDIYLVDKVREWIRLNEETLIKYWNWELSTFKFMNLLKKVDYSKILLDLDNEMSFDPYGSKTTGLPCIMFITEGYNNYIPQVRIGFDLMAIENKKDLVISIEDNPSILKQNIIIDLQLLNKILSWIKTNKDILMKYWNWNITSKKFVENIIRI